MINPNLTANRIAALEQLTKALVRRLEALEARERETRDMVIDAKKAPTRPRGRPKAA